MTTNTYEVADIISGHCEAAISAEVGALPGVDRVDVDLEHKRVSVTGRDLDDNAIRAAIYDAGYLALCRDRLNREGATVLLPVRGSNTRSKSHDLVQPKFRQSFGQADGERREED